MALFHADLLGPDVPGLVVVFIHGDVQLLLGHLQHLGEELPSPGNGLPLEVIPKGEVAQHLKIGAVAVGVAHVFNVAGADTLLAGGHTPPGGSDFPVKYFFIGAMPELISKRLLSPWGISEKLGSRKWPLDSKNSRYFSLSSFNPVHCIVFLTLDRVVGESPVCFLYSFFHGVLPQQLQGVLHPVHMGALIPVGGVHPRADEPVGARHTLHAGRLRRRCRSGDTRPRHRRPQRPWQPPPRR